jgi:hypothetical protein
MSRIAGAKNILLKCSETINLRLEVLCKRRLVISTKMGSCTKVTYLKTVETHLIFSVIGRVWTTKCQEAKNKYFRTRQYKIRIICISEAFSKNLGRVVLT